MLITVHVVGIPDEPVDRGETQRMAREKWRTRIELGVAAVAGVVLYNLHPTRLGNALVAYESLGSGETEGLSLEARVTLYAVLALVGAALLVACLLLRSSVERLEDAVATARSAGGLCLAGIAGLALDYRDGPQSWVHLAVLIAMALCAIRTFRLLGAELRVGTSVPGTPAPRAQGAGRSMRR